MPKKPNGKVKLSAAAEEAFQLITKQYTMSPDGTLVLLGALHNYDRYVEARDAVSKYGLLVKDDRGNLRKNPACAVEAQAYSNFLSGMRFFSLDATAEELLPSPEGDLQ